MAEIILADRYTSRDMDIDSNSYPKVRQVLELHFYYYSSYS